MKKVFYILIGMVLAGCSKTVQIKSADHGDSVFVAGLHGDMWLSKDSFMQVKNSLIYVSEEEANGRAYWATKEHYKWNYGYPDTITVALRREDGIVDSVEAVRYNENSGADEVEYVYPSYIQSHWVFNVHGDSLRYVHIDYRLDKKKSELK